MILEFILISVVISNHFNQNHPQALLSPVPKTINLKPSPAVLGAQTSQIIAVTTTPTIQTNLYSTPETTATTTATNEPTTTPISSPSPTVTVTPAPTNTPQATYSASHTSTPKPTPISKAQLDLLFEKYAKEYNIDKEQLKRIAQCESGLNPNATNLYYAGLYQFSPASWKGYRKLMGKRTNPDLRFDPEASINTASFMLSTGRSSAWPNCK